MITLILMLIAPAQADWLCTSQASQRRGDTLLVCGIGSATDEATARSQAFDRARQEFDRICRASSDCRGHKIDISPNRTECKNANGQITCHRLFSFAIGEINTEEPLTPEPFAVEDTADYPHVERGMTLPQLMKIWGKPVGIARPDDASLKIKYVYFEGPMCNRKCFITFTNGKVDYAEDVKIEYDGLALE